MLRFILAVMILIVMFKITQDNAYVGFGLILTGMIGFITMTNWEVDSNPQTSELDEEIDRNPTYYQIINSQ
jgi:hypothetical protein